MKYRLLTKEQLESLYKEFAVFLASQEIDVKEWQKIKQENPKLVQKELELFSDLVWDDVLTKVIYIEHFSEKSINLFQFNKTTIYRIAIKVTTGINFLKQSDVKWLLEHPKDTSIEYFKGLKKYTKERNLEIFDLIEKGGTITKGELFVFFNKLISFKNIKK